MKYSLIVSKFLEEIRKKPSKINQQVKPRLEKSILNKAFMVTVLSRGSHCTLAMTKQIKYKTL